MVLVVIAVAAGFQGERLALVMADALSRLSPLVEPAFLGISAMEWMVVSLVGGIAVVVIWRGFRR